MRSLPALVLTMALACAACTFGSDSSSETTARTPVTLASLDLDWPKGQVDPPDAPDAPAGYDDAQLERMAEILTRWARLAAADEELRASDDPLEGIRPVLGTKVARTLAEQLDEAVSPHLAVANVFGDDVTVVGSPQLTSAWRVATDEDEQGREFVRLQLQTRAAYEVRLDDGPARVIGVLRVHELSAYPDTTDDYGISAAWQEFGAGDCALALDDALVPESSATAARKDLDVFMRIGNGDTVEMPQLGVQDRVDAEYLKRCREGQV